MGNFKRKLRGLLPPKAEKALVKMYRNTLGFARSFLYAGNHVLCSCCGRHFRQFYEMRLDETYHNIQRNQAVTQASICPYCGSLPRHRLICRWLDEHNIKGGKILVFAPEHCVLKWFSRRRIHVVTTDLFDKTADVITDIQNMVFENNSFDLIICNHVLQHVPDDSAALRELKRILNGYLILTAATDWEREDTVQDDSAADPARRRELYGQADFLRVYGRSFADGLKKAGFSVEVITGEHLDASLGAGLLAGPAYVDYNLVYVCTRGSEHE